MTTSMSFNLVAPSCLRSRRRIWQKTRAQIRSLQKRQENSDWETLRGVGRPRYLLVSVSSKWQKNSVWRGWNHWRLLDDVYQHRGNISTQFQSETAEKPIIYIIQILQKFWELGSWHWKFSKIHPFAWISLKFLRPEEMDEEELQRLGLTFFRISELIAEGRWERWIFLCLCSENGRLPIL